MVDKEGAISKFFTYEDSLILQKKPKQSMSIKVIVASLEKDPTIVFGEVKKYSLEIATGHID